MKPERRGGPERASIGSSTRHLSTPLRDRSDCLNTPPARRNSPVSKQPRSCDHPSVLDLRSTNLVSARLAVVSEEKHTRRRLRSRVQSQPRHENGVATPDSQCSPVCGAGRHRRVLKTRNRDQQGKTNSPRLKGRRDMSVSPTKMPLRVRLDISVSPKKTPLRVRRDISVSPTKTPFGNRRDVSVSPKKTPLRVRSDISVSPTKTPLRVRRNMSRDDARKQDAESLTPRHALIKSALVVSEAERESPARPVCVIDQPKEMAGIIEEQQRDAPEQDTAAGDVMTGELATTARRKFCQLDGQYTADGRKVRLASSRFNRRRPQRKASIRIPQRKVSLRRPSRKASMRGCKTVTKNRGVMNEESVVSHGTADASQTETESSVLTGTREDVDHANEEKQFDGIGARSVVEAISGKSVASTEDSPVRKRSLDIKPSPDKASSHYSSLLSTQSARVSSAKKVKLDRKHDVESVEHEQQGVVTSSSVRIARKLRPVASTSGGTSIPEYKANVSGLSGELIPVKVHKVKVSRLNSGLTSSTVRKVEASGATSELTTALVLKINVKGLTGEHTSRPAKKAKIEGLTNALTNTPVQKVKVPGLATTTPVQTSKVEGLTNVPTNTPVQKVKVPGLATSTPVQTSKVEGLTNVPTNTPVQKVKVPGLATSTPVQTSKVEVLTNSPTNTPVQKAKTSQPATGLPSTSVQLVKAPGPATRTPMHVHFSGLKDEPPTKARQETQNTSEAAVTSTAEPPRPEGARTDAPTMELSPDETDITEERQIR